MSWKRVLVLAVAAVASEALFRVAWKRGFQSGSEAASGWWNEEMIRLIQLRDSEWRKAVLEQATGETRESESEWAESLTPDWLN